MVFQRKSGGKAKQQTPAKSKKSFGGSDLKDMDMDFDGDDNQVAKKTPKGKQAPNDKRVSFQIPGKNTPSNQGTPKGGMGKKQATPAKVGALKPFGGMAAKRNGKAKKSASDDDDDDDDDDEDDEEDDDDDSGEDGADLDMMFAGDSDEDDDEDDDDDDEDEEEDEQASKMKKNAKTVLTPKKKTAKEEEDDDDSEEDDDDDDEDDEDEELPPNKQNAKQPIQTKNTQKKDSTPGQNKSAKPMEKSPTKKETPKKTEKKEVNPIVKNFVELDTQRRRERDARTLYVGNLPKDIAATELKALSSDILAVNLPNHQKNKKSVFAFLEFASESKAAESYEVLKSKKLRGEALTVDYAGEKSLRRKPGAASELPAKDFNLKKLYIADIPPHGTMAQVAQLFPKSIQISLAVRPTFKSATILFASEQDCAEAIAAAQSAKIASKPVTVVYSIQRDASNKKKRKRVASKGKQQNQAGAKKMKLEVKEESDEDEDDSDEE